MSSTYRDKGYDELIAEMASRTHRCLRITENEMHVILKGGGKILSVEQRIDRLSEPFWVEAEASNGFFYADCETDPREKP
jgi:hypothetical protein